MNGPELVIRRFAHEDLPQIRQSLIDIHTDAYADAMDDQFNQRFPWFVDHWGGNPGFACVIAFDGQQPVAFAYGAPATPGREWWREHLAEVPAKHATFAYSELAVRTTHQKTGMAERMTRALLEVRHEDLAVLLVDTEHPRVRALYESWGFRRVGVRQPFADSPLYDVMLAELPLR